MSFIFLPHDKSFLSNVVDKVELCNCAMFIQRQFIHGVRADFDLESIYTAGHVAKCCQASHSILHRT